MATYLKFHLTLNAITKQIWKSEYRFDAKRRWRFDFALPGKKIAIEIEGGVFSNGRHTRGIGFIKDIEKYNAATEQGWIILRYTPQMINKTETFQQINNTLKLKHDDRCK